MAHRNHEPTKEDTVRTIEMRSEHYQRLYKWRGRTHRLRILPPISAEHPFGVPIWQHRELPHGEDIICFRNTWPTRGIHCALCCLFGHKPGCLRPRFPYLDACVYLNAIDRKDPKKGVQLLELPLPCYKWLLDATRWRVPAGNPLGDVTDIVTGRDLIIKTPRFLPLGDDYDMVFTPPTPLNKDAETIARWINGRIDTERLVTLPDVVDIASVAMLADSLREQVFGRAMGQPRCDASIPLVWCGITPGLRPVIKRSVGGPSPSTPIARKR
jgi:hypothetical protein